ncbi:Serine/threonine phosphatase stp [Posidoniimonas corsicana]|uniref:Serine/threonine phosphatase stp n=1 Tax=Posidoniimonas corsicana TaxID=1938618 RepID=A0A5C5VJB5_9BACT|nr:PP2C family serine/threonine-protein phosphatase [Posidoniimonas corsicana]TWT38171.1 Serine/threonine phosphatase stp [Posidoniimonas corsicana]
MVLTKAKRSGCWKPLPEEGEGASALWTRCDEPTQSNWRTPAGRVTAYSARSPGKETPNEDALAVFQTGDGSLVLAVADGMGGQAAGETAARLSLDALAGALADAEPDPERLRSAIIDGIEEANRAVLALANGAGATLAVALVSEPFVRSFHVGDASFLLMGQRGRVKFESIAHSPVGYAEAAGLINPEDALQHEERHIVSNCVGDEKMRIEIGPVLTMAQFDTLLIATDGLVDNVLPGELVAGLRSGPLDRCAAAVAELARERMQHETPGLPSKPDDLTFLAYRRG